ncbi:MAG: hypothetical protein EXQ77_02795 [Thermoleophilia bacterium]|nr:hypothetical protein [Thermoleophilia bacterium]
MEPTLDDIDALVSGATPHFAFQLRARVRDAVAGLAEGDPVRAYAAAKAAELEALGFASSLAASSAPVERLTPGWEQLPSSAPASRPLPHPAR